MKPRIVLALVLASIAVSQAALAISRQASGAPPTATSNTGGGGQIISPVVWATWLTSRSAAGIEQLELLILWRGSPGWFLDGGSTSGQSWSGNRQTQIITRGKVLMFEYDPSRRFAIILGRPVDVSVDNVAFVDDVDGPDGPRVTATMNVPRNMPGSAGQLGPILQRSREIMAFLRCDARSEDRARQAVLDRACLINIGVDR